MVVIFCRLWNGSTKSIKHKFDAKIPILAILWHKTRQNSWFGYTLAAILDFCQTGSGTTCTPCENQTCSCVDWYSQVSWNPHKVQFSSDIELVALKLARIVLKKPFRSPAAPLLKELHWLPVAQRVRYKIATLVFRCREGSAPSYLNQLLSERSYVRELRSTNTFLLEQPRTKTVVASRAFSSAGPRIWNELSLELRGQKSFESFKQKLKTFLFPLTA